MNSRGHAVAAHPKSSLSSETFCRAELAVPEVLDANVLHFVALLDFKLLGHGTDLDVANCQRKRRGVPSDHLSEYRHKRLSGIALVSTCR